ncbi:MAG: hypothetical protein NZ898_02470 [Myxococcota bacterium]|nr:hypothetical protein [Myxococcota bacterium]MDW8362623.1 hypothetical protein [Myxococcales bacterium]
MESAPNPEAEVRTESVAQAEPAVFADPWAFVIVDIEVVRRSACHRRSFADPWAFVIMGIGHEGTPF